MPSTPDLPPIDAELRQRLTDDIRKRGVLVPILQAEDGEVLDGRLRLEIALEYKLFCPKIIVGKLSASERADLRLCVNLYRRHLNQARFGNWSPGSSGKDPRSPTAAWASGAASITRPWAGSAGGWRLLGRFPNWIPERPPTANNTLRPGSPS